MSSNLKDARWQLAIDWAAEDGKDFLELDYHWQDRYLEPARRRLSLASTETIDALAARFRTEN
ncbi:hypothetical protein SEA_PLATTE_12 [Microbacterium phage Platte]|nr:hypothetical protein SEA_PLATTE_12 [Microbacterium phage Platte]